MSGSMTRASATPILEFPDHGQQMLERIESTLGQWRKAGNATRKHIKREPVVRPGLFVVLEVMSKNPPRVVLIQHDHMVETLPPRRSDEPLDVRILPG